MTMSGVTDATLDGFVITGGRGHGSLAGGAPTEVTSYSCFGGGLYQDSDVVVSNCVLLGTYGGPLSRPVRSRSRTVMQVQCWCERLSAVCTL